MNRGIKKIVEPMNGIQFIMSRELREELKPIVFFDSGGSIMDRKEMLIDFHPHSGVGILTYIPNSQLHHKDTSGEGGVVPEGGAQWMLTGGGMFHRESYRPGGTAKANEPWKMFIIQLWLQLPPEFEEAPVEYKALLPEEMPRVGNVKVLIGEYNGVYGGIQVPLNISYLDVHLKAGEKWSLQTPIGQTRGLLFPRGGAIRGNHTHIPEQTLGILEEGEGLIQVEADGDVDFVVILAEPSPHPVIAGRGSMHTTREALNRSIERIDTIGRELTKR